MRMSWPIGALAACWLALSGAVRGQDSPTQTSDDSRFERLERRLEEMERKHDADLKSRDEEIARLKSQLNSQSKPAVSHEAVEHTRSEVLNDAHAHDASPLGLPAEFRPELAVIVDTLGTWSSARSNDAYNRFDARETVLDLRAPLGKSADGVVILSFARDIENPVFPEPGAGEDVEVESGVSVEEAYAVFHDFGVPGLGAKLGRFHVRFGQQNLLHLHDLPTTDPPFVNQAFLAPESLSDAGFSFAYVIPPGKILGQHVELTGELLMAEGGEVESPVFTGGPSVDSPATNLHLLWSRDLTREINLELGGSWVHGHRDSDNRLDADLFGFDFTLTRRDPSGGYRDTLIQAEAIYGDVDQSGGSTEHAFGAYLLGQQQLSKTFYAGCRLDWTENPNDDAQEMWGVTPYVTWQTSDFLRLRFGYQHRGGDRPEEDVLLMQCTFILGGHDEHAHNR